MAAGWTAHFLARGYDVTAYLHDVAEADAFMSILNTAWISLTDLGLAAGASRDRLRIVTDLKQALEGREVCARKWAEKRLGSNSALCEDGA